MSEAKCHRRKGKFTEGLLEMDAIFTNIPLQAGQTVLDAGCGNGYMAKRFSEKVTPSGKVYALDTDQHFIAALKNEIKGTNIDAIEGDITTRTEFAPSTIDLLFLSTVIHSFSKQQRQGFFREAKRLLKPDAFLAIVEIEKRETPFGPPLTSRFSAEELRQIVPLVPGDTVEVGEHFYMQLFKNSLDASSEHT